jgi:hypothetical protein
MFSKNVGNSVKLATPLLFRVELIALTVGGGEGGAWIDWLV